MVTVKLNRASQGAQGGFLLLELFVALGIIAAVLLPLTYGQWFETGAVRTAYQRAVAMEIVDGELEVLAAGEWRQFGPGEHEYRLRAAAATNLPPGQCRLSIQAQHLRLEWKPTGSRHGRAVVRETDVR